MRLWGLVFRALRLALIRSARAAPVGPSLVVLTLLVAAVPAAAQSYTVLYSLPTAALATGTSTGQPTMEERTKPARSSRSRRRGY
jgi:hypothetical protein